MPPSNAQLVLAAVDRYNQAHPRAQVDPQAVLGIASHEGLSGGIGDNGTSFGAFQLHEGGALPAGIPLSQANQWAWSPAGLDYALGKIGAVAGGLHGLPAIEAISTRFERPANPQAEIQDAARHYGLAAPGMAGIETMGRSPAGPAPMTPVGPNPQQQEALQEQQARVQAARTLAQAVGNANTVVGLPTPAGLGNLLAKAAGARR